MTLNCSPISERTHKLSTFDSDAGRERECDCQEWIVRCAHFDNRQAYIVDRLMLPAAVYIEWMRPGDPRFFVFPTRDETDDYDAALAAFHAAEAELLAGGGE